MRCAQSVIWHCVRFLGSMPHDSGCTETFAAPAGAMLVVVEAPPSAAAAEAATVATQSTSANVVITRTSAPTGFLIAAALTCTAVDTATT
jgi:hypothetical protein